MNITTLANRAVRKLMLLGLLIFPFMPMPGYAVELVGKPVAVGRPSSAEASSAQQALQQAQSDAAAAASEAANLEIEARSAADIHSAKQDIEQAMDEVRSNFTNHENTDFGDFMSPDVIIPVVAISLLFGGPVLLVIVLALLHYNAKSRRQKNINMNIDKLLAAGRDIPLELLLGEEPRILKSTAQDGSVVYTHSDEMMRKGIRNIGLGTGWLIFLTIMFGIKIGAFGFIFIGLGISQVVIWKLSSNNSPGKHPSNNHAPDSSASDGRFDHNHPSGAYSSGQNFSDNRTSDKPFADKNSTAQLVDPVKVQD